MARPIATRHAARETLHPFAGRKARILVAEDNVVNQHVALGILKKLGLRADAVADGVEAVKALETIPYDLVLMDVQMPVMDGIEATRHIRSPESAIPNCRIPIIAMTAHAMQGDRERCLEAGMNDYVPKPVTPQALAEGLAKWLPGVEHEPEAEKVRETKTVEQPIWDKAGLLERLMDDRDLAKTIMEAFLDDIPQQIQALKRNLEARNMPGAESQAHNIRGASASVGGEALREVAFAMERAAKAGDLGAAGAGMSEMEVQFGRLKAAVEGESQQETVKGGIP